MKKNTSVILDEKLIEKLKKEAIKERRSISSQLEIILERHFSNDK